MSTPTVSAADQLEQLDIKLASLGGLDLSSTRQILTTVGSAVTFAASTNLGQHVGLSANERLVSLIVGGALIAAYVLGKSLHHAAIERGNAQVKVAAINAATSTATPVVLDSPPDAATERAVTGRHVATDPMIDDPDLPKPPDVGFDLPVETVSTALPGQGGLGAPQSAG